MTLSPISTRLPIDTAPSEETEVPAPWTQRTSYIAGKSAPTTPRILSRSPSQTRLGQYTSNKLANSKSYTHLAGAGGLAGLTKSQSTGQALYLRGAVGPKRKKKSRAAERSTDDGEWLYRTGTGITSEARESKGQSWLVSRESSISLVAQREDDDDEEEEEGPHYQPIAPRSTRASRAPSRITSARQSRRGSKVGSRADLTYFATPAGARTPASVDSADYFGRAQADPTAFAGPDFVNEEELEEEEQEDDNLSDEEEERRQESEVKKLTSQEEAGLGGIVGRLFNWSLLDEGAETDDEKQAAGRVVKAKQAQAKQENASSSANIRHAPSQTKQTKQSDVSKTEESHGWADAAWLLSVASKVLL